MPFVVFEFAKHELHQMEKKSAINEDGWYDDNLIHVYIAPFPYD